MAFKDVGARFTSRCLSHFIRKGYDKKVTIDNYTFKFFVAISITPLIYLAHYLIDMYLGKELSIKAKESALEN